MTNSLGRDTSDTSYHQRALTDRVPSMLAYRGPGAVVGVLVQVAEVTKLKQAEAALQAGTDAAIVETLRQGDRIVVRVSDAGVGFDPARLAAAPRRGLGLVGVRERLSFIGGTAEVSSVPGDGTVAVLSALLATHGSLAAQGDT